MFKKLLLFAIFFLTLTSCNQSDNVTLVSSSGRINHVLIVIKNSDWQSEVGDALREIIGKPVDGLPQEEAQFSINQVPPNTFNSLFKRSRNILFVGIDTSKTIYTNSNIYANPQKTLTILGKNRAELVDNINSHKDEIINTFKKNDLIIYQKKVTKEFHKINKIETFNKLEFSLKIPKSYAKVEDTGDFLWYRNSITKGFLSIISYEIPLSDSTKITKQLLTKYRDSIGKKFIPGQFDNTYFKTETQFSPVTSEVLISGEQAIESRGLWIVENDYMGGPFLSYAIKDRENNRLLVLMGFSYSPSVKKRDFVFELEAILKTVQLRN